MKAYQSPTLTVTEILQKDILTSSPGVETPITDEEIVEGEE